MKQFVSCLEWIGLILGTAVFAGAIVPCVLSRLRQWLENQSTRLFKRPEVRVTIRCSGNWGNERILAEAIDQGLRVSYQDLHHAGEIVGFIQPHLVRRLSKIRGVQRVIRHRSWVDRLSEVLDPA